MDSKNWWDIDRTLAWSQVFVTTHELNINAKEGYSIWYGKINKDFGNKMPQKLLDLLVFFKYQSTEWNVWETSTVFMKKRQSYQLCSRN